MLKILLVTLAGSTAALQVTPSKPALIKALELRGGMLPNFDKMNPKVSSLPLILQA